MSEVDFPVTDWLPDEGDKTRVARYANRLQMVTWDRFTSCEADGKKMLTIYGWIRRTDGQHDFVVMLWEDFDSSELPWCCTSSAKHSMEISQLLYGDQGWYDPAMHADCVRVEEHFTGHLNWIKRL